MENLIDNWLKEHGDPEIEKQVEQELALFTKHEQNKQNKIPYLTLNAVNKKKLQ